MGSRPLCSILASVLASASVAVTASGLLAACATSPADDVALGTDEAETRPGEEAPPAQPLPAPSAPEDGADAGSSDDTGGGDAGQGAGAGTSEGGLLDGGQDGATTGPQSVVIKLVPSRSDWLVAGQRAPFLVQLDAKNCNIFGNSCDANVSLALSIDAPATSPASAASCSRLQAGTGVRQCVEGSAVTKTAMLKPGDEVKVRFHAEAVDDPGANPSCDVDKTWTFTGAGFTLKGETFPATSAWPCIGGGSGQNLDVLLGYTLSL